MKVSSSSTDLQIALWQNKAKPLQAPELLRGSDPDQASAYSLCSQREVSLWAMSVHYRWDPGQNQEFPAATAATVGKAMLRQGRQEE